MSTPTPDLEARLRAGLTDLAEDAMTLTDTPRELARLEQQLAERRRRRGVPRWTVAVAAAAAVALGTAVLLPERGGPPTTARPTTAPFAGTPVTEATPQALPAGAVGATSAVRDGEGRMVLATYGDEVLVVSEDEGGDALLRFDAATGAARGAFDVAVPAGFELYEAAPADGGLLVTLLALDRAAEVNTVYVQLDASGRETSRLQAQYFGVGNHASTTEDGTWVGLAQNGLGLLRDGEVVEQVTLPFAPSAFAAAPEGFWLTDFSRNRVVLVDRRGAEVAQLSSTGPLNVLVEGAHVVVAEARGLLLVERADRAVQRITVADIAPGGRGLATADGAAYGVFDDGTLVAVQVDDPATVRAYDVPAASDAISATVAGELLWLGAGDSGDSTGLVASALLP